GVTMVKSNAREGSIATGVSMVNDTSLRNMGHNLMTRLECESLLLTRSEHGMILFEKKNITSFPAFKGPKPAFNAVGVRDCQTAVKIRPHILGMLAQAKSRHPGGSLSAVGILVSLYFYRMRHDPKRPDWPDRDRFVLSKGHAAPVLFATLAEAGYIPISELKT